MSGGTKLFQFAGFYIVKLCIIGSATLEVLKCHIYRK